MVGLEEARQGIACGAGDLPRAVRALGGRLQLRDGALRALHPGAAVHRPQPDEGVRMVPPRPTTTRRTYISGCSARLGTGFTAPLSRVRKSWIIQD